MALILFLITTLILVFLLKAFQGQKSKNTLPPGFPVDFCASIKIPSLSLKSKISNTLFIDSSTQTYVWCKTHSKIHKPEIVFNHSDISKILEFEVSQYNSKEKEYYYVQNIGLELKLKSGKSFEIYLLNDSAYVRKPLEVYTGIKKLQREYFNFFHKSNSI